jgi:type IV pilus biogenesis protein CpaD/CtpE
LIKGKLKFKLPDCDDVSNYKNNLLVGYKFGCSTQYNLLQMLKDPNDLLSLAELHNVD